MGKLPSFGEPKMAVCTDNKETRFAFQDSEQQVGSHLESHRKLSTALGAAALKFEWPCRMMAILPRCHSGSHCLTSHWPCDCGHIWVLPEALSALMPMHGTQDTAYMGQHLCSLKGPPSKKGHSRG